MNHKEAQVLIDAIKGLIDSPKPDLSQFDKGAPRLVKKPDAKPGTEPTSEELEVVGGDFERLYHRIKNRLLDECQVDPVLLHLLTTRPEIVVEVEPRRLTMDGSSLKGRIARLMAGGFFSEGRRQNQVRTELMRTGTEPNSGGLSTAMNDFVKDGFLVRDGDSYSLAAGVRVTEKELVAV